MTFFSRIVNSPPTLLYRTWSIRCCYPMLPVVTSLHTHKFLFKDKISESNKQTVDIKVVPKIRSARSFKDPVKSYKFITPLRAMREYILSSDNSLNVGAKAIAWWLTGSKSMFSEMMHSIADTLNQILIAYGLHSSLQRPDDEHPYGYMSMRNVSSLISGVAVFFLGSGLTFYHGIQGILYPQQMESLHVALLVMLGSLVTEGTTLAVALSQAYREAKKSKQVTSLKQWFLSGKDPTTSVVILEDAAAVLGVLVAGCAMGLSAWTEHPLADAVGALGVSLILAGVAALIIHTNTEALLARAIPVDQQEDIMRVIESFRIIRGTYDIKATTMGSGMVRFKAEVDIDGRELTKAYLESLPLHVLLDEAKNLENDEQLAHFMLKHGDNIVNTLGAEINRIEQKIKKTFPDVKHIDIEIN